MRKLLILCAALALAAPALADHHKAGEAAGHAHRSAAQQAMTAVLAHPRRAEDRARDAWRHPAETLAFFKVEPGMTVVDFMPSGGWYTRVLVPYLGESGRYIGLNPDVRSSSERLQQMFGNLAATFPAKAAEWTGVPASRIAAYNTDSVPAELNGTVDRVLIFREIHNMHRFDLLHRELTAMRALLKPDGLLGVVQHRAKADAPASYTDGSKGYLREKDVIGLIEAHGYELVGKSEINANPADPANHPAGVWSLPPNFSQKDVNRAGFAAIGESDRMTLLFRKRP
jgi:predicted methyltransferase